MSEYKLVMPKLGESINEATVISWLKNEGDKVEVDEAILEIATDKVDSEVPSEKAGILIKKLCNDGDVVKIGEPVAIISLDGNVSISHTAAIEEKPAKEIAAEIESNIPASSRETYTPSTNVAKGEPRFYSPLVMNIAKTEGLPLNELEMIHGTGQDGRVTKRDILFHIKNRGSGVQQNVVIEKVAVATKSTEESIKESPVSKVVSTSKATVFPGDEIIEMDRMRKLISDHMVNSKHTSPHVTSFVEADVTNLVNWRNAKKDVFKNREGENLTFTPLFIECIVKAIKDFPLINVVVDGNNIIKRKNINIGMAAALPSGNLIVPVVKNADFMNLTGLAKTVNDLANRARTNNLKPDEIQGGTYTVTNVGTFGNISGTPIINQPQVAIMAMGAIIKKPAVLETEHGDVIAIRHKMMLSHAYDHRVVDGALGGMFVKRVAEYLEQWDINRDV